MKNDRNSTNATKPVCALAAAALVAGAVAAPSYAQEVSKGLDCRFETGHTWTFEAGKPQSSPASPLQFAIAAIDLEKQSAQLILDGSRTGTLRIVRALNANSYLEVAQEGFLNLTTIYDQDPATGAHPAVHSRHFGLLGQPMFAQYAGSCTPK